MIIGDICSFLMAEGAGFEPALGGYPKHAFQACDLSHSSTLPCGDYIIIIIIIYLIFRYVLNLIYITERIIVTSKHIK
jgi:hypothetical protein